MTKTTTKTIVSKPQNSAKKTSKPEPPLKKHVVDEEDDEEDDLELDLDEDLSLDYEKGFDLDEDEDDDF